MTIEALLRPPSEPSLPSLDGLTDRRADVDAKQAQVAALLREVGCDGLLLTDPDNFGWITSGGASRANLDPDQQPVVFCTAEGRWILAANHEAQRLFDEEVDGLGFQLKEWPWHWGRDQLLADLCANRKVACDRPRPDTRPVADELGLLRRSLSPYEQACLRSLGLIVSHALEATCRTCQVGQTERELAGQIVHRLVHRGAQPIAVGVATDGRSRLYRQFGYTPLPVRHYAVLTASARKYGLCASASRTVSFGSADADLVKEHNAVCRVSASYLASTWPDAVPREILLAGRRIYLLSGFEHEWLMGPQGYVTGRRPVELSLGPATGDLFRSGWVVTWTASAGAACGADTFLLSDGGPLLVTPTEQWPLKLIRVQGNEFVRPDILHR